MQGYVSELRKKLEDAKQDKNPSAKKLERIESIEKYLNNLDDYIKPLENSCGNSETGFSQHFP